MTKSGKHCGKWITLLVLSNFFFCHYVFKKLSAAEASESVYMRKRVKTKLIIDLDFFWLFLFKNFHRKEQHKCSNKSTILKNRIWKLTVIYPDHSLTVVNFSNKQHFILNCWTNFNQTPQECGDFVITQRHEVHVC